MNWTNFALAVLVAGLVASLTDWFFMGVLFHDKYMAHPEVWRLGGKSESELVVYSTLIGFVTAGVFAFSCYKLNRHSLPADLKLAVGIWLMAPLPLIVTNGLWMKIHPSLVVSHALGWLARLCVAAVAVALIMG